MLPIPWTVCQYNIYQVYIYFVFFLSFLVLIPVIFGALWSAEKLVEKTRSEN